MTVINITISAIIIIGCFLGVVVLVLTEKLNRTIAAVSGALITYFTLTFIEGKGFSTIIDLLFGSETEGFVNLHSLILIIAMMFIVQISDEAGLFQFLAVIAIKWSKGKPLKLMTIFCIVSILFSAILNNILTIMILIPLTITVSRILNIDPTPYIITQAVLVNIGGTIFSISSIPNILIVTSAGISFTDYFLNVGLLSIITAFLSITLFIFLYKPELVIPRNDLVNTLAEFDIWNVVQSRRMVFASIVGIFILMLSFILVPEDFIPPDIIALSIAMVLTILSGIDGFDAGEMMKKFDYELIFYLLGIFTIAGGLEITGVIALIGDVMENLGGGNQLFLVILIMWVTAILSSLIDNIPITKVLIPIVTGLSGDAGNILSYGLSIGANWGDNLTPLGDNILVLNIAKQNKRPITMKRFWKLGFTVTLFQLLIATLYFILVFSFQFGLVILAVIIIISVFSLMFIKHEPEKVLTRVDLFQIKLSRKISRIRKMIIR
ncbi:MAG: SLC13 family permease [Candidatus Hodarchaeales archaeon]